jgi:hypothetical protein
MPIVRFFGRIHPTICRISLALDPSLAINWRDEERDCNYTFKVHIADGNVRVECDASNYDPSFFDDLYRRSLDLARAAVDVIAFGAGLGLTVILEKFQDPSGSTTDLLFQDTRLVPLVTAFNVSGPPPNNLEEVLKTVWAEPVLFFALRDLIEAITLPHRAPVCCGRAVEGLRNLVAPASVGTSRAAAWEEFRRTLQLDHTYLKLIMENSVAIRHGHHSRISGETTVEITRRSWTIMNRFLHYRLLGNKQLLVADFPVLHN